MSVSVCPRASPELHAGFYTDFFVFVSPMAVAQSFSDGISTSSLMDDIIVAQDGQYAGMSILLRRVTSLHRCVQAVAPLLRRIGCVVSRKMAGAETRRVHRVRGAVGGGVVGLLITKLRKVYC